MGFEECASPVRVSHSSPWRVLTPFSPALPLPVLSEHSWLRSSYCHAGGNLGSIYYRTQGCSHLQWQAVWFRWNNDLSGISVVLSSSFLKGSSLSCQLIKFKAYKNLLILFVRQFFFFLPSALPPSLPGFLPSFLGACFWKWKPESQHCIFD